MIFYLTMSGFKLNLRNKIRQILFSNKNGNNICFAGHLSLQLDSVADLAEIRPWNSKIETLKNPIQLTPRPNFIQTFTGF